LIAETWSSEEQHDDTLSPGALFRTIATGSLHHGFSQPLVLSPQAGPKVGLGDVGTARSHAIVGMPSQHGWPICFGRPPSHFRPFPKELFQLVSAFHNRLFALLNLKFNESQTRVFESWSDLQAASSGSRSICSWLACYFISTETFPTLEAQVIQWREQVTSIDHPFISQLRKAILGSASALPKSINDGTIYSKCNGFWIADMILSSNANANVWLLLDLPIQSHRYLDIVKEYGVPVCLIGTSIYFHSLNADSHDIDAIRLGTDDYSLEVHLLLLF
jgi:hypothetical protein